MNYDIVIVAHEKDFNNIKFIVKYADIYLKFDSIHLILSERQSYCDLLVLNLITPKPIYIHKETDILKIDKTRLKHRPNWMYQMMLKFFQDITQNSNYLVIEADSVIIKPLEFFEGNRTIFYLGRDQHHKPYFNFNKAIMNIGREYNHSFISEFMMYDKNMIKSLLSKTNCKDSQDFLELLYKYVTPDCYPADYELYGNFVYKFHNDKFMARQSKNLFTGKNDISWTDIEINQLINSNLDYDVISFHCWKL